MRVYEHSSLCIDFIKEHDYFLVKRIVTNITKENEYKEAINNWRIACEKYKPTKHLVDYSEYSFSITPEFQQYLDNHLMKPLYKAGLKKIAFLLSHDLFAQLSIEETMQKETGKMFEISYFDDFEEAKKWLLATSSNNLFTV